MRKIFWTLLLAGVALIASAFILAPEVITWKQALVCVILAFGFELCAFLAGAIHNKRVRDEIDKWNALHSYWQQID